MPARPCARSARKTVHPRRQGDRMRRREFITLAGVATAWPLLANAQQAERMRRIGVLLPIAKEDRDYQPWISAFLKALQELGWTDGDNVRVDIHWATANPAEIRKQAAELAALAPDVILAPGTSTVGPLMQATHTVPIVFPIIADPVAGGRQRYRLHALRIQHQWKMAGVDKTNRTGHYASGSPWGSRYTYRPRPVRRNSGRGAVAQGGGQRIQQA